MTGKTENPYIIYFLIKVYTPSIMVCIPFCYFPIFTYIYLLTVTEEGKYIVNTGAVGVGQWWDRLRQGMGGCLSQVGSQVMGWQVTSTTHLSDPNLQFTVRSVLRRAGPTLFYLKFAERGYPARQVARISPPGRATDRRRQAESMPGQADRPGNIARPRSYFMQKTNAARKPCPPKVQNFVGLARRRLSMS